MAPLRLWKVGGSITDQRHLRLSAVALSALKRLTGHQSRVLELESVSNESAYMRRLLA